MDRFLMKTASDILGFKQINCEQCKIKIGHKDIEELNTFSDEYSHALCVKCWDNFDPHDKGIYNLTPHEKTITANVCDDLIVNNKLLGILFYIEYEELR